MTENYKIYIRPQQTIKPGRTRLNVWKVSYATITRITKSSFSMIFLPTALWTI